ncbi:hypothetical protein ABPG72_012971 [Tetrahymena utriculariae]
MAKTPPNYTEDYFYKALVEALQSKDSNLIYLVIKTIWDKLGEKSFDYFSKEEILSALKTVKKYFQIKKISLTRFSNYSQLINSLYEKILNNHLDYEQILL